MTSYQKKLLLLAGTVLTGGGIPVFSKLLLREMSPTEFMTIRFFSAWLIMLPLVVKLLPRKLKDWWLINLVVLPASLNMVLFARGLLTTTATMATLIYSFSPIAAAIMVYAIGQEKLNQRKLTGIFIGFIGMLIIILAPLKIAQLAVFVGSFQGNLLIFLGMVLFTVYTVASKSIQAKFKPETIVSILFLNGALVNALAGGYTIFNPVRLLPLSATAWLALSFLVLINSILFFWLYQVTLKYTSAVTVSMASYLYPIITFIWAAILLSERLNPLLVIGGGLTIIGAYLTTKTRA